MAASHSCDRCGKPTATLTHEERTVSVVLAPQYGAIKPYDSGEFAFSFQLRADRDLCAMCLQEGIARIQVENLRGL